MISHVHPFRLQSTEFSTSSSNSIYMGNSPIQWAYNRIMLGSDSYILFDRSNTGPYNNFTGMVIAPMVIAPMQFSNAISSGVPSGIRINGSNGFVGICASNPEFQLDVVGGTARASTIIQDTSGYLEMGYGFTKATNAGRIGYGTLTTGALDIVGAGTTVGFRNVKCWDNLFIDKDTSNTGNFSTSYCKSTTLSNTGNAVVNYLQSASLSNTGTASFGGDIAYSGCLIQNGTKIRICSGTATGSGTSSSTNVSFPFTFSNNPVVTFGEVGAAGYLITTNITALSTTVFSFISPSLGLNIGGTPSGYYGNNQVYWQAVGN